jgi:hypothetical protein
VVVSLSPEAKAAAADNEAERTDPQRKTPGQLTEKEQALVQRLQARDAEVRAHEAAHAAAAAGLGGRPAFSYQTGPDGRRYASGGEVGISMSAGSTPDETIARAEQIRAAALAPADPSPQYHAVAAAAAAMEAGARQEQLQQRTDDRRAAAETALAHAEAGPRRAEGDPGAVVLGLASEAKTARGGWDHAHGDDGCSFCTRAAGRYRATGAGLASS